MPGKTGALAPNKTGAPASNHHPVTGSHRPRTKSTKRIADADPDSLIEVTLTLRGPKLPQARQLAGPSVSLRAMTAAAMSRRTAGPTSIFPPRARSCCRSAAPCSRAKPSSGPATVFDAVTGLGTSVGTSLLLALSKA